MAIRIEIFENKEFGQIRTVEIGDKPWFVGKDVALALKYAKPQNALAAHVDDEDKTSALIRGIGSNYKSKAIIINESGLYALIFGSKLPSAKRFKHWVTSEILPTIRKTGVYSMEKEASVLPAPMQQERKLVVDYERTLAYNRGIVLGVLRSELEEDSALEIYERLSARGKGIVMKMVFGEVVHVQ